MDENGKSLYAKLLSRKGKDGGDLVTDDNVESVLLLVHCWQTFMEAAAACKGKLTVISSTGNERKNPAYDIAKTALENFVRISKTLGIYDIVQEETGDDDLDGMVR